MKTLKPQFKDMRLCRCGAPAEILGKPWDKGDAPDWWPTPVELPCSEHDRGAEPRSREFGDGNRAKQKRYHVQVFTHVCTRNSFEDAAGNPSEAEEHRYECGAIMQRDTTRVSVDKMFGRCFDEVAS